MINFYEQRFASRAETQERHSSMRLVVREAKMHPKSANKRSYLRRLFTEARWFYNWCLQQHKDGKKLSEIRTDEEFAIVLTPGGYEVRRLARMFSCLCWVFWVWMFLDRVGVNPSGLGVSPVLGSYCLKPKCFSLG